MNATNHPDSFRIADMAVTVNESLMEIPAKKGQDFVWHVKQRNKKTYFKFDIGESQENVE